MLQKIIESADGPTTIFLPFVIGDILAVPAYTILILFYGIYFYKLLSQKKHGIKTTQFGGKKEKHLKLIETCLQWTSKTIVLIQVIAITSGWTILPITIRIIGWIAALSGDLIFLIAIITMKSSWRAGIPVHDKTELITNGIYKYSRNPAFLGFYLMYTGILLMYFNILLLLITIFMMILLHLQILQEERYLELIFGDEYIIYKKRTCRYLGIKF